MNSASRMCVTRKGRTIVAKLARSIIAKAPLSSSATSRSSPHARATVAGTLPRALGRAAPAAVHPCQHHRAFKRSHTQLHPYAAGASRCKHALRPSFLADTAPPPLEQHIWVYFLFYIGDPLKKKLWVGEWEGGGGDKTGFIYRLRL